MSKKIKASIITYRQGRKNLKRQRKELINLFKDDILKIYKDKTPNNLNDLLTKFRTLPIEQQNRLLESILKFDSGANPKYTILDGIKQMIFHPIKRNKTLDYIITGQGKPKLFSSHRINPYNGLFGNDYKALGKVSEPIENGFIDAMIYGKEINTNIGKASNPLDFGIEYNYVKQNYPSKKVQYITTEPKILENQENIKPTIYYGAKGSFKTKMPGITINNQGIILEEGVRNDSTFVRGLDVYDFKTKDYVKKWLNDDVRFFPTIQHIDNVTTPVAVKTPWVYKDNINNIIGHHSGFDFLNFDFNTIDSNKSIYKQSSGIPIHFKMGGKQKQNNLKVKNGIAQPLGDNYFLMRGPKHEQGGIDIGKNLEVEGGEIVKLNPKSIKVLSNAKIMGDMTPSEYALGGLEDGTFEDRYNKGFKYQEKFKDVNGLNDDGTKQNNNNSNKAFLGKLKNKLSNFYWHTLRAPKDYSKEVATLRNGTPFVVHNVHGEIVKNKEEDLIGSKHPYEITSVYRKELEGQMKKQYKLDGNGNALSTGEKIKADRLLNAGDWINIGANSLGAITNLITGLTSPNIRYARMRDAIPIMAPKINSNVNTTAEEDAIDEAYNAEASAINNNTSNSQVALNRLRNANARRASAKVKVRSAAENTRRDLINKGNILAGEYQKYNIGRQEQVDAYNRQAEAAEFNANKDKVGNAISGFVGDIMQGASTITNAVEQRNADRINTVLSFMGNPNINVKGFSEGFSKIYEQIYGRKPSKYILRKFNK